MDIQELENQMIKLEYEPEYIDLCVNYAKKLSLKKIPVIFDIEHLCRLIGISQFEFYKIYATLNYQYSSIKIKKKSGGFRELNVPSENLKYIQRWILDNILYYVSCSESVCGFMPEKSIVDNAKIHVNKECVIGFDIKNFFPTIHFGRVKGVFEELGYASHLSIILANICTYKGVLPQGAPTSPYIANLICRKLDYRLETLCKKYNADYTRYADDITISGDKKIKSCINTVKCIICDEGFSLNNEKQRVLFKYNSQRVTGIVVNEKMSPPKEMRKYLRQNIYYINKYGIKEHLKKIECIEKSHFKEHLYGIAYYIKMIDKKMGCKYLEQLNKIEWEV